MIYLFLFNKPFNNLFFLIKIIYDNSVWDTRFSISLFVKEDCLFFHLKIKNTTRAIIITAAGIVTAKTIFKVSEELSGSLASGLYGLFSSDSPLFSSSFSDSLISYSLFSLFSSSSYSLSSSSSDSSDSSLLPMESYVADIKVNF